MTWTNAFDLGACTVEVFLAITPDAPDYSATLAKGEGADLTIDVWDLHVAVSADGVVTLGNVGGSGIETDMGVRVLPGYALSDMVGARAVSPASVSGSGNASADGSTFASFNTGDASVDLSAQSPYDRISAQTTTIGSSSGTPVLQFTPEFDAGDPVPTPTYNCDCDDTTGNKTLKQLRDDMMVRLGFAAQVNNPPPGMAALLNSFLTEAQELLYRRYDVLRTERFYSWALQAGVRMYDFDGNDEACTKRLDPRKVTWVGIVRDGLWHPLACGIAPELYSTNGNGWPQRYEIRQCIEVWPAPAATEGSLVIKGHFGLEAFAADTDKTTIDDRLVFLLALSNAKAHYGRPDAGNYVQELETLMGNLVAGSHNTRRYIPGRDGHVDYVYSQPKPTEPFA